MKGTMTWTVSCSCGWSGSTTDIDFHDAVLYDLEAGHECKAKRQKHAWRRPFGGPLACAKCGATIRDSAVNGKWFRSYFLPGREEAYAIGRVRGPVPPCPGSQTWTDREEEAHKSIVREIAKEPE